MCADVAVAQPDEKSIITYVSSLYDALPPLSDRGDTDVSDGMGGGPTARSSAP